MMDDFDTQAPNEPSEQPSGDATQCGICDSTDVQIFEGFYGSPDVAYCMNCGAMCDGDEPWLDPFAF